MCTILWTRVVSARKKADYYKKIYTCQFPTKSCFIPLPAVRRYFLSFSARIVEAVTDPIG